MYNLNLMTYMQSTKNDVKIWEKQFLRLKVVKTMIHMVRPDS